MRLCQRVCAAASRRGERAAGPLSLVLCSVERVVAPLLVPLAGLQILRQRLDGGVDALILVAVAFFIKRLRGGAKEVADLHQE